MFSFVFQIRWTITKCFRSFSFSFFATIRKLKFDDYFSSNYDFFKLKQKFNCIIFCDHFQWKFHKFMFCKYKYFQIVFHESFEIKRFFRYFCIWFISLTKKYTSMCNFKKRKFENCKTNVVVYLYFKIWCNVQFEISKNWFESFNIEKIH